MFDTLLIANRGEIACRVATTARRLAVSTVAVHSVPDADALHVRLCDRSVCIGGGAAADSYLRIDRLIEAALATGAQAIHPGYGFLSENAGFARACQAAGLVFVGPPAAALATMGDKAAAKTLMAAIGVPLLPGYHGTDNDPAQLLAHAHAIGFPVLIKAVAGGGGRGMRRVDHPAEFAEALAACRREAQAGFADARVLVERCLNRPRHVEVQVFADQHGNIIHLHERDCSVQRRHQKVLEEAPAPGLGAACRARMGACAVAAARAVAYVGAGTVEFIVEPDGSDEPPFHFMEMNTRLQVEHPVTEAITGLDLVEWQLRIAAGERLPLAQHELPLRGHAIEARICAEHPAQDFMPATGKLALLRWPPHHAFAALPRIGAVPAAPDVRIDAGYVEGDIVSPHYDSLLAKLIVWGEDREQAMRGLVRALRSCRLAGVASNLDLLARIVDSAAFRHAELDTALIARQQHQLFAPSALPLAASLAGAVVALLQQAHSTARPGAPWSAGDSWRQHGAASRLFRLECAGQVHLVSATIEGSGSVRLRAAQLFGDSHGARLHWRSDAAGSWRLDLDGRNFQLTIDAIGNAFMIQGEAGRSVVRVLEGWTAAAAPAEHAADLRAPLPGRVMAVLVAPGDAVCRGQPLLVLEAMKMEHTLAAPRDGRVSAILCVLEDRVAEGVRLIEFAED
ncbi:MAG: ATP-grasp domain-containing protein [Pseudomonadota bacterium]|nr:ATP-grasp domain-containing protein [Pseudomonadota bacterium]